MNLEFDITESYRYRAAKGKNDYHPDEMRNGMKRPAFRSIDINYE